MWGNETGADAAPAGQMGNEIVGSPYLFGPSIHLWKRSILPAQQEKKKEELVWECKPPEAFRSVPTGHHPGPLPT